MVIARSLNTGAVATTAEGWPTRGKLRHRTERSVNAHAFVPVGGAAVKLAAITLLHGGKLRHMQTALALLGKVPGACTEGRQPRHRQCSHPTHFFGKQPAMRSRVLTKTVYAARSSRGYPLLSIQVRACLCCLLVSSVCRRENQAVRQNVEDTSGEVSGRLRQRTRDALMREEKDPHGAGLVVEARRCPSVELCRFRQVAADSVEVIDTVVRPDSMAGPQAVKMLVTAEQMGRTPEFSVAVVTVGAAARKKRGQRLGVRTVKSSMLCDGTSLRGQCISPFRWTLVEQCFEPRIHAPRSINNRFLPVGMVAFALEIQVRRRAPHDVLGDLATQAGLRWSPERALGPSPGHRQVDLRNSYVRRPNTISREEGPVAQL